MADSNVDEVLGHQGSILSPDLFEDDDPVEIKPLVKSKSLTNTVGLADKRIKKSFSLIDTKPSGASVAGSSRKRKLDELRSESSNVGSSANRTKPLCKYGGDCYRKNLDHLERYDHQTATEPGKSDSLRIQGDKSVGSFNKMAVPTSFMDSTIEPYRFLLTKAKGIPAEYNEFLSMDIKEILSPEMGELLASAQFNYMMDVDWLIKQYPSQFRKKPLLLVCGEDRQNNKALRREISPYPNVTLCQARLEIMYGTHHTKMMFLLYEGGLRIVIHTANLIHNDWHQKTQGMWLGPICPRLDGNHGGDSVTGFKHDMMQYLSAYQKPELTEWIEHIRSHDLSAIKVNLLGSVPGRHLGENKARWGHMRLRTILQKHGPKQGVANAWPVLGQFSSIGSLGQTADGWLRGEFLQSLSTSQGAAEIGSKAKLQLVFPSKDNVRQSLEGYPGGASLPYSINVAKRQPYLNLYLHQWKSSGRGRSCACPHIKSYARYCPVTGHAAWFLLTSANLSKAAWGALEKSQSQLMIRSYELGVLFLPQHLIGEDVFRLSSKMDTLKQTPQVFPLPYDLPPKPYSPTDKPWIWDIAYKDLPDSNGNMWCPS